MSKQMTEEQKRINAANAKMKRANKKEFNAAVKKSNAEIFAVSIVQQLDVLSVRREQWEATDTARALYVPKVDNTGAGSTDSTTTGLAGVNRAQVTDIGAFYSNGPLNIGLSQQQHKYGATALNALVNPGASSNVANGDYKLTTLAANYKFGDATVYGAVWTEKQATVAASAVVIDASAYMVGAKYSMGAVDFLASYAKRNDKSTVDSATAYANSDRSIYGLGVDYNLSKRTALWVRYENKDPNTNRSGVSGLSATTSLDATKTTAIGVRHTF